MPGRSATRRRQRGGWHIDVDGDQVGAENVVVLYVDYRRSAADSRSPEAVTVGIWSGGVAPRRPHDHGHVVAARSVLAVHAARRRRAAAHVGAGHDVRRARPLTARVTCDRASPGRRSTRARRRRCVAPTSRGTSGSRRCRIVRMTSVSSSTTTATLTPAGDLAEQLELDGRRGAAIALGAHDQPVTTDAVLGQPTFGVRLASRRGRPVRKTISWSARSVSTSAKPSGGRGRRRLRRRSRPNRGAGVR